MDRCFFGTDGVRDQANQGKLTPEIILRLGQALGQIFGGTSGNNQRKVVICKDTRLSGYLLEYALTAGLVSVGMQVILVGPMPTPAMAWLVQSLRADLGLVVSASHNTYEYNGLKIFDHKGYKLSDQAELQIENLLKNPQLIKLADSQNLGKVKRLRDSKGRYIEKVKDNFAKHLSLKDLSIVLDCNHGAAYVVAHDILTELGARVIPLGCSPDGYNINRTEQDIAQVIKRNQAFIGVVLDGDGDRVSIFDEQGKQVDGDQLLAALANYRFSQQTGQQKQNASIILTEMSTIALTNYLTQQGMKVMQSKVGDRYIAEAMRQHGSLLGGEKSGHIMLKDINQTGDGILAGLQIIAYLLEQKQPAGQLHKIFPLLPQISFNIDFTHEQFIKLDQQILNKLMHNYQKQILQGRVVLRKSGTEPVLRVLLEGLDRAELEIIAKHILTDFREKEALDATN